MNRKILSQTSLEEKLGLYRTGNKKLVFTNGCFDLLHVGHLEYLSAARKLGDVLFVGVNDDDSVKRLKGTTRPINLLDDRMQMLAALETVDFVIPFSEDTPLNLIQQVNPQILVKGGDYKVSEVVGGEYVSSSGGEVIIIPFKEGYSSTALIHRIQKIKP